MTSQPMIPENTNGIKHKRGSKGYGGRRSCEAKRCGWLYRSPLRSMLTVDRAELPPLRERFPAAEEYQSAILYGYVCMPVNRPKSVAYESRGPRRSAEAASPPS
jgi:hypothetical protein